MFRFLMGMVISYGIFDEQGRKIMNKSGNFVIEQSKKGIKKYGDSKTKKES